METSMQIIEAEDEQGQRKDHWSQDGSRYAD